MSRRDRSYSPPKLSPHQKALISAKKKMGLPIQPLDFQPQKRTNIHKNAINKLMSKISDFKQNQYLMHTSIGSNLPVERI